MESLRAAFAGEPQPSDNNNAVVFASIFWLIVCGSLAFWNFFLRNRDVKLPARKNFEPVYDKPEPPPDQAALTEEIDKLDSEAEYLRAIAESQAENDILYGKTDTYEWQQGKSEVELWFPVDSSVTRKEVSLDVTNKRLSISIQGNKIIEGQFYAEIIAEDSNWQFEEVESCRRLLFTAPKREPTQRNQHWRSLLKGDKQIDVSKLGPPVHAIDVDDKSSIKEAVAQIKRAAKANQ